MLQLGLNLMVPSWGGPMSQLGQALGGGFAAGGRAQQLNTEQQQTDEDRAGKKEDRASVNALRGAQTEKTLAEAETEKSGESARSRRLRGKTPTVLDELAASANLGPKGKAYVAQRLKTINQEDLLGEDDASPSEKFNQILTEAQKLDAPSAPAKAPNVGGTETVTGVPIVKNIAEAQKLPSGTKFRIEVNGKMMEGTVP
jgi:hypothetical protein